MRHSAPSPPAASVFRPWALTALLPLLCDAGAAPAGRLPEWLLGDWTAVEVHQYDTETDIEGNDPKCLYTGRTMTVTPDRLTFVRDACEVGSVRARHGPLSVPTRDIAGVGPDALGLPRESKPVSYIAIQCARSLVGSDDGHDVVHDRGIKLTWYVVVRSPTEIDMPFLGLSYVKFRRASPTS